MDTAVINAAGVPCGPVLDLEQALTHPITRPLDMVETVEHPALGPMKVLGQAVKVEGSEDGWLRRAAPLLGEHTVEVARRARRLDVRTESTAPSRPG